MSELIEPEIIDAPSVNIEKKDLNPQDIIQLEKVVEDYNQLRVVILDNVARLKVMSDNLAQDLEIEGYDAERVMAYSKLVETSNKSLKILTDSYKGISDIIMNVAKIKTNSPNKEKNTDVEIISTSDILKRLKSKD